MLCSFLVRLGCTTILGYLKNAYFNQVGTCRLFGLSVSSKGIPPGIRFENLLVFTPGWMDTDRLPLCTFFSVGGIMGKSTFCFHCWYSTNMSDANEPPPNLGFIRLVRSKHILFSLLTTEGSVGKNATKHPLETVLTSTQLNMKLRQQAMDSVTLTGDQYVLWLQIAALTEACCSTNKMTNGMQSTWTRVDRMELSFLLSYSSKFVAHWVTTP